MPRASSADLRERAIAACEAGLNGTNVARRYRLGERTVHRWRRVARTEGRRCAKPPGGGRRAVVTGPAETPRQLGAEGNDATLVELVEAYRPRTGRALSPSSMCRALKRLGLTRKKEARARRGARAA